MAHEFRGIELQPDPPVYLCAIPGQWLLRHTTPSWRIKDPIEGFQRIVDETRARKIAAAVLDQGRTFPNAIVLATDNSHIEFGRNHVQLPQSIKFLVVDGQHRLWAQRFSEKEATYACLIHPKLDERQMAKLFVEINDTQKRVPASLRWDLVRLVREDEDSEEVRAVDLVYELNTTRGSPLYQRIDLTGETKELTIKQGSIAPEIKRIVKAKESKIKDVGFDIQLKQLIVFLTAVSELDPEGWREANSNLYNNRVLRALLLVMMDILNEIEKPVSEIRANDYFDYLKLIKLKNLDREAIVGQQGSAGINAIYKQIIDQIFE